MLDVTVFEDGLTGINSEFMPGCPLDNLGDTGVEKSRSSETLAATLAEDRGEDEDADGQVDRAVRGDGVTSSGQAEASEHELSGEEALIEEEAHSTANAPPVVEAKTPAKRPQRAGKKMQAKRVRLVHLVEQQRPLWPLPGNTVAERKRFDNWVSGACAINAATVKYNAYVADRVERGINQPPFAPIDDSLQIPPPPSPPPPRVGEMPDPKHAKR